MRILISPAKKMRVDPDSLPCRGVPMFLSDTEEILSRLREMSHEELQKLWKCSDQIARLNFDRLRDMELHTRLTPAVLSYEGIQYQYMAPGVFSDREYAYIQEHLRILSGFYGLLRPFDGVTPYRLEMQAKLEIGGSRDLYAYWGGKLAAALGEQTPCILNLASREYSVAVSRHLPSSTRFVTCVFGEYANGKVVEKGTMCKMARGEMVRFLAETNAQVPEQAKAFDRLHYRFAEDLSNESKFVFLRDGNPSC